MGQTAHPPTSEDPGETLAQRRLHVLNLAKELGNVSEACRRGGIDRTSFYAWKRRFEREGLDGLKDRPPVPKHHPMTTAAEGMARIQEVAMTHPACGCNKIEGLLAREGRRISAVTIQKTLNSKGLGTREQRWLALEQLYAGKAMELSPEQVAFMETFNPCFRERHAESTRPGQLLATHVFMVGSIKGIGRVYLHIAVDTHSSYAFGFLDVRNLVVDGVSLLHSEVLPFFDWLGVPVEAIELVNGRKYYLAKQYNPVTRVRRRFYESYLNFCKVQFGERLRWEINGFVQRFKETVMAEFVRPLIKTAKTETLKALRQALSDWLHQYNYERPHFGYRNHGRTPWDIVEPFIQNDITDPVAYDALLAIRNSRDRTP